MNKNLNIYVNGNNLQSSVIKQLVEKSPNSVSIIINIRGMRYIGGMNGVTVFSCSDESLLTSKVFILDIMNRIKTARKCGSKVNIYVPHTEYLLTKVLKDFDFVRYNYLDNGTSSYASILDHFLGTNYFQMVQETYGFSKKKLPRLPLYFSNKIINLISKLTRFTNVRLSYVTIFLNLIKNKLSPSPVYYDYYSLNFDKHYIINDKLKDGVGGFVEYVNLDYDTRLSDNKSFLILLPPSKVVGELKFNLFCKKLSGYLVNEGVSFFYKCHPVDKMYEDYFKAADLGCPLGFLLKEIDPRTETSFWAYSKGYLGVFCYDTSSTIVAKTVLKKPEFIWVDFSENIFPTTSVTYQLINKINELVPIVC